MSAQTAKSQDSRYGTLGVDVGAFGRWSRLIWGLLLLLPLTLSVIQSFDGSPADIRFYAGTAIFFGLILAAYTAFYWFLGERVFAHANPWLNTAIFVGSAFLIGWWDLLIGPFTGINLPGGLSLAMLFYIGISFVIQWRIAYGGCEVVSIPILLFKRRLPTYCIPLVALDAVEKAVVDRRA